MPACPRVSTDQLHQLHQLWPLTVSRGSFRTAGPHGADTVSFSESTPTTREMELPARMAEDAVAHLVPLSGAYVIYDGIARLITLI